MFGLTLTQQKWLCEENEENDMTFSFEKNPFLACYALMDMFINIKFNDNYMDKFKSILLYSDEQVYDFMFEETKPFFKYVLTNVA